MMKRQHLLKIIFVLCIALVSVSLFGDVYAQTKKSKKQKTKPKAKTEIHVAPGSRVTPTFNGGPGTVEHYFFPTRVGTTWMHRTVRFVFNDTGNVVNTDTAYNVQTVLSNSAFSIQKLPLIQCESYGYSSKGKDTTEKSMVYYYVDDSIAMTVMNNSVSNILNRVFLVTPLTDSSAWHEKYGDTSYCAIESIMDSCTTPMRKFDSVICTVSRSGYKELRKYYAPRFGLVKTIFRSPGQGGHGVVAVVTEMMAMSVPEEKNVEILKQ